MTAEDAIKYLRKSSKARAYGRVQLTANDVCMFLLVTEDVIWNLSEMDRMEVEAHIDHDGDLILN